MKRFLLLLVLGLTSLTLSSYAQEICNNGIDDDNNGFIDCFDQSCANNTLCSGSYIGNDAVCEAKPTQFPAFRMTLDWASPNRVTNHLNRMSIGDLDRDGIPEVVVTNIEDNNGSRGAYVPSTLKRIYPLRLTERFPLPTSTTTIVLRFF
jgi:hypothetical protein